MWIFLNNKFVKDEDAVISVFDHGFLTEMERMKRCAPMALISLCKTSICHGCSVPQKQSG